MWLDTLLRGEPGEAGVGSTWRNGSGAPSDGTGADGDYYLRTSNGDVYKRAAGTYSVIGNIKGPAGATGSVATVWWSIVDMLVLNPPINNAAGGVLTTGCKFHLSKPFVPTLFTGVRFHWASGTGRTIKAQIWGPAGSIVAKSAAVTAGPGIKTILFDTPHTIVDADFFCFLYASISDVSGTDYTSTVESSPIDPSAKPAFSFPGGAGYFINHWGVFISGDNKPTSTAASEKYPVEPIFG